MGWKVEAEKGLEPVDRLINSGSVWYTHATGWFRSFDEDPNAERVFSEDLLGLQDKDFKIGYFGCSDGRDMYSWVVAALYHGFDGVHVEGFDLSKKHVDAAKRGLYIDDEGICHRLNSQGDIYQGDIVNVDDGLTSVRERVRERVSVEQCNFAITPPPSTYDIAVLRHTICYPQVGGTRNTWRNILGSIREGGILVHNSEDYANQGDISGHLDQEVMRKLGL